jgi:hypothetical protein
MSIMYCKASQDMCNSECCQGQYATCHQLKGSRSGLLLQIIYADKRVKIHVLVAATDVAHKEACYNCK